MRLSIWQLVVELVVLLAIGGSLTNASAQAPKTAAAAKAYKPADPNPVDPTIINELVGMWENDELSILVIKAIDQQSGAISGTYRTQKDDGTPGDEYPLIGWVNTAKPAQKDHVIVVSFSVRWGEIGTVTAWNGYYHTPKGKQPRIVGQWLLSKPNSDFDWDHILAGQDQFHRVRK